VDGTFIDPRDVPLDPPDNTQLHELLNAERANIAAELAAVRGATVSHFKFSGRSAHEVVHKLGRQTLTALMYLTGMRSQETLEHLVAPESHLRTETRGLGAISAEEADLVEAECLWEAEEAWRRKKTCTLTPREAVTPPEPEADGPGQKATARPAPEETDAEKTGANPAGEWWKNGPPEPDSKFRTNPIEASLKQLAHGIGYDERAVKEGNGTSGWWIQKIHRYKYRAWFDSAGMAEKVTRLIEAGRASKRAEERRSAPNDKKPKRRTS
jgi:hypothetical protein